jgi:uncharacterized protein YdeI (YjbR/CyaY-like superfamily)
MVVVKDDLPIVACDSQDAWAAWLDTEHESSRGVWLKIAKKGAAEATVSYAEALDVALCYGWIDGQKGAFDDAYWLQRFTPRGPRSPWSRVNREKASALIEAGAMRPAGMRQVEAAKADGRWEAAYAGQRTATVPEDLQAALDAHPAAKTFFATLNSANRYAILYRLQEAKRPETRARRLEKFITMLEAGETVH